MAINRLVEENYGPTSCRFEGVDATPVLCMDYLRLPPA